MDHVRPCPHRHARSPENTKRFSRKVTGFFLAALVMLLAPAGTLRAAPLYPVQVLPVPGYPYSVAVGDFNEDGHLDMAAGNSAWKGMSLFLGRGDGTFETGPVATPQALPFLVAASDFNEDGHLDLVFMEAAYPQYQDQFSLAIATGAGDGTFGVPVVVQGQCTTGSFAVTDLNGDSHQDLVYPDWLGNVLSVRLGNGDGSFAPEYQLRLGYLPVLVTVADFNLDGFPDVAAGQYYGGVTVMLGDGAGGYAAKLQTTPAGTGVTAMAVEDFDGDGYPDLALVDSDHALVMILLGRGDGSFLQPILAGTESDWGVVSVTAGDLDQDGVPDLVVANDLRDRVGVLTGRGGGFFSPPAWLPGGRHPAFAKLFDANEDGRQDLVVAASGISQVIGTLTPIAGDLSVYLGGDPGGLDLSVVLPGGAGATLTAVGDLNGDLVPDLALAKGSRVSLWVGEGNRSFSEGPSIALSMAVTALERSDMNGDGRPDLVAALSGDNAVFPGKVAVLLAGPDGTFGTPVESAAGIYPRLLVVGDFNEDGFSDLVVSHRFDRTLLLLGSGDGSFGPGVPVSTTLSGRCTTLADFNGDANLDVAVVAERYFWWSNPS